MRQLYGLFLISIYVSVSTMPCFHIAYFLANQEYIQEVICINKSRPELQCNGKCFLKQKIQESQEPSPTSGREHELASSPVFLAGFLLNSTPVLYPPKDRIYQIPYSEELHGIELVDRKAHPS